MPRSENSSNLVTEAVKWYIVKENVNLVKQLPTETVSDSELFNFSFDVSNIGEQCSSFVRNFELSDLLLLLGAGGAVAYLWKTSWNNYSIENSDHMPHNRTIGYQHPRLYDNHKTRDDIISHNESISIDVGLNAISKRQVKRSFLKHRLFDISQLRNTSRFKNIVNENAISGKSNKIGPSTYPDQTTRDKAFESDPHVHSRLDDSGNPYAALTRGVPDGEENPASSTDKTRKNSTNIDPKIINKTAVNPNIFPLKGSMLDIIQNAKEVRRLIREASFDSKASDLWFDLPSDDEDNTREDVNNCIEIEKEDSMPPPLDLPLIDNRELLRLVGFSDRESSIFSEISDDWRDEKTYKVALGLSSNVSEVDDFEHWQWDEDCCFEDDFTNNDFQGSSTECSKVYQGSLYFKDQGNYRPPPPGRSSTQFFSEDWKEESFAERNILHNE